MPERPEKMETRWRTYKLHLTPRRPTMWRRLKGTAFRPRVEMRPRGTGEAVASLVFVKPPTKGGYLPSESDQITVSGESQELSEKTLRRTALYQWWEFRSVQQCHADHSCNHDTGCCARSQFSWFWLSAVPFGSFRVCLGWLRKLINNLMRSDKPV